MKSYSEEQKYEVLQKYLYGYTPKEITNGLDIHRSTVYRWIADWKEGLKSHTLAELPIQDMGAILTHVAELEKLINEQNRTISIIHKSHMLQSIPLKHRLNMGPFYPPC